METSVLAHPEQIKDVELGSIIVRLANGEPVLAMKGCAAKAAESDSDRYVYFPVVGENPRTSHVGQIVNENEVVAVLENCEIFLGDQPDQIFPSNFDGSGIGVITSVEGTEYLCVRYGQTNRERTFYNLSKGTLGGISHDTKSLHFPSWSVMQKRGDKWHKLISFPPGPAGDA